MKWKSVVMVILAICALVWVAQDTKAQTASGSGTVIKYGGGKTGQLMGAGKVRWRLATLCADADTSMVATSLVNLWNESNTEVPRMFYVSMLVDSAAGGGAGSRLHLRAYRHAFSAETGGTGAAQYFVRSAAIPIDTLNVLVGTGASAYAGAFAANLNALFSVESNAVSPYISFRIDKEGVKKFTAGYVDVYWKTIR